MSAISMLITKCGSAAVKLKTMTFTSPQSINYTFLSSGYVAAFSRGENLRVSVCASGVPRLNEEKTCKNPAGYKPGLKTDFDYRLKPLKKKKNYIETLKNIKFKIEIEKNNYQRSKVT